MRIYQILALAMFLGSIPFEAIVTSWLSKGKSSLEMTPAQRRLPIEWLVLTVFLALLKGFIPVYLAGRYELGWLWIAVAALVAALSDVFPYWFMFKRTGRGWPVALGALFAVSSAIAGLVALIGAILYMRLQKTGRHS